MRYMMLLAMLLSLLSLPVWAQTPETIAVNLANAAFAWDWTPDADGGIPEAFEVRCGPTLGQWTMVGQVLYPTMTLKVRDIITAAGDYVCVVVAANIFGVSDASNEVVLKAGAKPGKPKLFRLVSP